MKKKYFALDLGTTKFCLACLELDYGNQTATVDWLAVPAGGMKSGMLERMDRASAQLATLIGQAEEQFKVDLPAIVVGVAGRHLASTFVEHLLSLHGQRVGLKHCQKLQRLASLAPVSEGREQVLALPVAYQVDARPWSSNPLQLTGQHLRSSMFSVTADKHYLRDLVRLCNSCGVKVSAFQPEPVASASAILGTGPYRQGAVIIDIGGGSVDGVAYRHSVPVYLFTLRGGGEALTDKIGFHWNLSLQEAERVKRQVGFLATGMGDKIECLDLHGRLQKVSVKAVVDLLIREFTLLSRELKDIFVQLGYPQSTGLLITGGGSELLGCEQVLAKMLSRPVAKLSPDWKSGLPSAFDAHSLRQMGGPTPGKQHATVIGMLLLAAQKELDLHDLGGASVTKLGLRKVWGWLRELKS
ncbi:MAG: hypothetical protein OXT67_03095 [Zetaproteobacteria bacterium]|nr:hypothetical protein [Zetaproteobacteria bacterium]